jgi:hypothetical protein
VIAVIAIRHVNNNTSFQRDINRHRNILIIGRGANSYKINEVVYYNSPDIVEKLYGNSQLSDAFRLTKNIGVNDVFVVNAASMTDYIEIADLLKHYDFSYIVPIGINFSDSFFNPLLNRQMTYAELYLESISGYANSSIMMTDKHASLYEDMDQYLDDMKAIIYKFKNVAQKALMNGRNMCLVGNNLQDYEYANVVLASVLCTSSYDKYPEFDFGPAVFDIDDFDLDNSELIYFKNNYLTYTSVENLKNFRIDHDAVKIVPIDIVIKYIERELDFSDIKGKAFTEYVRLKLNKKLDQFLRGIINIAIRDYSIQSIDFVKTSPSAGTIVNYFSILPINSTEVFDIAMEV